MENQETQIHDMANALLKREMVHSTRRDLFGKSVEEMNVRSRRHLSKVEEVMQGHSKKDPGVKDVRKNPEGPAVVMIVNHDTRDQRMIAGIHGEDQSHFRKVILPEEPRMVSAVKDLTTERRPPLIGKKEDRIMEKAVIGEKTDAPLIHQEWNPMKERRAVQLVKNRRMA